MQRFLYILAPLVLFILFSSNCKITLSLGSVSSVHGYSTTETILNSQKPEAVHVTEKTGPTFWGSISDLPYHLITTLKNGWQQIVRFFYPALCRFTARYHERLLGLTALLLLWLLIRSNKQNKKLTIEIRKQKLDAVDLAAIKVIKDNAAWVLEKNRPGRNVVRLDDFRQ